MHYLRSEELIRISNRIPIHVFVSNTMGSFQMLAFYIASPQYACNYHFTDTIDLSFIYGEIHRAESFSPRPHRKRLDYLSNLQ